VPTATDTTLHHFQDWVLRARSPQGINSAPLTVLLHGWTGDENVMWVFAGKIPRGGWVISPRGIVAAEPGGYGWIANRQGVETPIEDFFTACDSLDHLIDAWIAAQNLPSIPVNLVGFSQGAALAAAYSLVHPAKVGKLALLAGFLPTHAQRYLDSQPLRGKQVYVAHGSRDETVPLRYAENAVEGLHRAGAQVDYCVSDVGHKLGAECMNRLGGFFSARE
jgi:phospholipase/carboxylesterase